MAPLCHILSIGRCEWTGHCLRLQDFLTVEYSSMEQPRLDLGSNGFGCMNRSKEETEISRYIPTYCTYLSPASTASSPDRPYQMMIITLKPLVSYL